MIRHSKTQAALAEKSQKNQVWHNLSVEDVLNQLGSTATGLSSPASWAK